MAVGGLWPALIKYTVACISLAYLVAYYDAKFIASSSLTLGNSGVVSRPSPSHSSWHVIIDMGGLVRSVFEEIWNDELRRFPPAEFNQIFSFLVMFRLHQLCALIATAYKPLDLYITCLWDHSSLRPFLKYSLSQLRGLPYALAETKADIAILRREEAQQKKAESDARRWIAKRDRQSERVSKEEGISQDGGNAGVKMEIDQAGHPAEKSGNSKTSKLPLIKLDQVIFPAPPAVVEVDSRFSPEYQFQNFSQDHLCHQESISEADFLIPTANEIANPTSSTVPFLSRISLAPSADHRRFIHPGHHCSLNTADSDFSYLAPPLLINYVFNTISLGLDKRRQMQIQDPLAEFFNGPLPPVDPTSKKLPVSRMLNWLDAAEDQDIFPFPGLFGRVSFCFFVGFDYYPGGWNGVGPRHLHHEKFDPYRDFFAEPVHYSTYMAYTPEQQVAWNSKFDSFLRLLPKSDTNSGLDPELFLYIRSYALGQGDPYDVFNKRELHQDLVNKTREDLPSINVEAFKHAHHNALAHGTNSQLRNHRSTPVWQFTRGRCSTSSPPSSSPSSALKPSSTRPIFESRPPPFSYRQKPLTFTRQLRPTMDGEVRQQLATIPEECVFEGLPTLIGNPPSPAKVKQNESSSFRAHEPGITTIPHHILAVWAHLLIAESQAGANSDPSATPKFVDFDIAPHHADFGCHIAAIVAYRREAEAYLRIYWRNLQLVLDEDPRQLFHFDTQKVGPIANDLEKIASCATRQDTKDDPRAPRMRRAAQADSRYTGEHYSVPGATVRLQGTLASRAIGLKVNFARLRHEAFSQSRLLDQILLVPEKVVTNLYTRTYNSHRLAVPSLQVRLPPPPDLSRSTTTLLLLLANDTSSFGKSLRNELTAKLNVKTVNISPTNRNFTVDTDRFPVSLRDKVRKHLEHLHFTPRTPSIPPHLTPHELDAAVSDLFAILDVTSFALSHLLLVFATIGANPSESDTPSINQFNASAQLVETVFPAGLPIRQVLLSKPPKKHADYFYSVQRAYGQLLVLTFDMVEVPFAPNGINFDATLATWMVAPRVRNYRKGTKPQTKVTPTTPLLDSLRELEANAERFRLSVKASNSSLSPPVTSDSISLTKYATDHSRHHRFSSPALRDQHVSTILRSADEASRRTRKPVEELDFLSPAQLLAHRQRQHPGKILPVDLASSIFFQVDPETPDGEIVRMIFDEPRFIKAAKTSYSVSSVGYPNSSAKELIDSQKAVRHEVVARRFNAASPWKWIPNGTYWMSFDSVNIHYCRTDRLEKMPLKDYPSHIDFVQSTAFNAEAYESLDFSRIWYSYLDRSSSGQPRRRIEPKPPVFTNGGIWKGPSLLAQKLSITELPPRPLHAESPIVPTAIPVILRKSPQDITNVLPNTAKVREQKLKDEYQLSRLRVDLASPIPPGVARVLMAFDEGHAWPAAICLYYLSYAQGLAFVDLVKNTRFNGPARSNQRVGDLLRKAGIAGVLVGFEGQEYMSNDQISTYLEAYRKAHPGHKIDLRFEVGGSLARQYGNIRKRTAKAKLQSLASLIVNSAFPAEWQINFEVITIDGITSFSRKKGSTSSGASRGGPVVKAILNAILARQRYIKLSCWKIDEHNTSRTCPSCGSVFVYHPTNFETGRHCIRITACSNIDCEARHHRDAAAAQALVILGLVAARTGYHFYSNMDEKYLRKCKLPTRADGENLRTSGREYAIQSADLERKDLRRLDNLHPVPNLPPPSKLSRPRGRRGHRGRRSKGAESDSGSDSTEESSEDEEEDEEESEEDLEFPSINNPDTLPFYQRPIGGPWSSPEVEARLATTKSSVPQVDRSDWITEFAAIELRDPAFSFPPDSGFDLVPGLMIPFSS